MMKLIMEKLPQTKQMEIEMEKMVEEKEKVAQLTKTTMEVVPLTIMSTATPTTTTMGTGSHAEQLTKSMESMNLQIEEIKRLETQFNDFQDHIKRVESAHSVEMRRARTLIEKLQKSEKEPSIGNTLGRVKEIIWNNIINGMNDIWPNIQIIFEQKKLAEKAKEAISTTDLELGDMFTTTNRIIKFLNSKNMYELE